MGIRYEVDDGVATLLIDRPEKKNALTQAMYSRLAEGLAAAAADDSVRALLITGHPGVFTAGNDLHDFLGQGELTEDAPVFAFMRALAGFEKPVVAAVTGHAVGIGVTLLLHCDLVYVAAGARLSLPFVSLGLVPEFASSLLLPQRLGHARAAELLLLGKPFTAEEAVAMGLANDVVAPEQVAAFAREIAARFNELPPDGVRESKRLMKSAQAQQVQQTIAAEGAVFGARLGGAEVREAVAAFFEKRPPDFASLRRTG